MIRSIAAASLVLLCMTAGQAWGQSCAAAATGLAFGPYQPLAGTTVTTAASVTITCGNSVASLLVSYTIGLSAGGGGSYAARTLAAGSGRLNYQIYTDPLGTQVWGDGTAGSTTVKDGYLLGIGSRVVNTYPAYGVIGAGQRVPLGSYMDTIVVAVNY